jgi:hypothetical protein
MIIMSQDSIPNNLKLTLRKMFDQTCPHLILIKKLHKLISIHIEQLRLMNSIDSRFPWYPLSDLINAKESTVFHLFHSVGDSSSCLETFPFMSTCWVFIEHVNIDETFHMNEASSDNVNHFRVVTLLVDHFAGFEDTSSDAVIEVIDDVAHEFLEEG